MAAPDAPRFRLLGELRIAGPEIRGSKQRLLLAYLLLHAGDTVATERLVDAVWGDHPPVTATAIVHTYIRKLRDALSDASAQLVTRAPGYVLELNGDDLDVRLFERTVAEGRAALANDDAEDAAAKLAEALSLWRGNPLADLEDREWVESERTALQQLRLEATVDRIAAELELGAAGELVPELETLVRTHPYDERFRKHLMLALYRSGRQHEALRVYRDTYRLLTSELGLGPTRELQQLEAAILRQDESLATPAVRRRQRARRLWLVAAAVAALATAGAVATVVAGTGSSRPPSPPKIVPNSLVQLDPRTGRVVSVTAVGHTPLSSTVADGAIWVVNRGDRTVSRVDLRSHVVRTIGGVPFADDIASDAAGNVWVSSSATPLVTRITAGTASFPSQPTPPEAIPVKPRAGALAVGGGYLWVANAVQEFRPDVSSVKIEGRNTLSLLDLRSRRVVSLIRLPLLPLVLAFGYGSAWVGESDASAEQSAIAVIRAGSTKADSIALSTHENGQPLDITIGDGSIWVLTFSGSILRIDPDTRRIVARTEVPDEGEPLGIAYGAGAVWVTNRADFSVWKIDPRTNGVSLKIPLGAVGTVPCGVAATQTAVWVTMGSDTDCGSPGSR